MAKLDELLRGTDVFFSNRHPGHLEQVGLTADKVAVGHRGLIHAQVLLHGAEGPWAARPGFDEIGACVSRIFALGGTLEDARMPPMLPIVDNIVGWFGKLFTATTPLGTYQGMTDQIEFSSLPQGFTTTVLHPMGADQPEWLQRATNPT
jgi:hypothetical protein